MTAQNSRPDSAGQVHGETGHGAEERKAERADGYFARQDVLGLALDLHMHKTGSFPDLPLNHRDHAIAHLRLRLSDWASNGSRSELFDEAVRLLLIVAVREAEEHKERWG